MSINWVRIQIKTFGNDDSTSFDWKTIIIPDLANSCLLTQSIQNSNICQAYLSL